MEQLTPNELERYSRQIALPDIGIEGQTRLRNSSVLILGAGGLGSPLAIYLCAAGIGHIGIADFDTVDRTNLQRQILHTEADIGRLKVDSACEKLQRLNSSTTLTPYPFRITRSNAAAILESYDFILDALDNFDSKLMVAETAWNLSKPHSYGGIDAFSGLSMTILPGQTSCLRCVFRKTPPQPPPVGPFGMVAGLIASVQASEAVKYLAGIPPALAGILFYFDTLTMNSRKIPIHPAKHCVCHPEKITGNC